jgi:hypothetical protein
LIRAFEGPGVLLSKLSVLCLVAVVTSGTPSFYSNRIASQSLASAHFPGVEGSAPRALLPIGPSAGSTVSRIPFCRTSDHSTMAVATRKKAVHMHFYVSNSIPSGHYDWNPSKVCAGSRKSSDPRLPKTHSIVALVSERGSPLSRCQACSPNAVSDPSLSPQPLSI